MRTTSTALLALRLSYAAQRNSERLGTITAVLLAATGITISSFSLKQMLETQKRKF